MKMSESEPSDDASKFSLTASEPGQDRVAWDESGGYLVSWLGGVRRTGGMSVVRALGRNSGTSRCIALPIEVMVADTQGNEGRITT